MYNNTCYQSWQWCSDKLSHGRRNVRETTGTAAKKLPRQVWAWKSMTYLDSIQRISTRLGLSERLKVTVRPTLQVWYFILAWWFTSLSSCVVLMSQSHDFWRAYSSLVARVASFAPKRSEGVNDATRDTNKQCARQKSCDYHYHQYTRPNRTNSFHKIYFRVANAIYSPHFAVGPTNRSDLERAVCHLAACSGNNDI